ncbi:septation protein A [Cucumibacter marinus]|uniref:septation protein A n=1 Tax=Cucumibacter marinus TaxID=1121252 RepID=UPI0003F631A7|nr:septation protein A [Cucumibacter marinus]
MSDTETKSKADEEVNWETLKPQLTKLALELGPLILFFLANARGESLIDAFPSLKSVFPEPIFLATGVFMVAMVVSLVLSKLLLKRIAVMPLVTGVVVLVFGGLTLWLQDDTFIKMKPTIVNILFGGTLLAGLPFGLVLLRYVFGDVYKLTEQGWLILTWRWGVFFLVLAVLNEIVWRNFSTDFWVAFKVWGIAPITLVFSLAQLGVLSRHAVESDKPEAQTDSSV